MAKRFLVLSLFCILVLSIMTTSFVSSKTPTTTTSDYGLRISFPSSGFLKAGEDMSVRWWVYNITDGKILTNTTTNCTLNLLNVSGYNVWRVANYSIKYGIPSNPQACQNCFNTDIKGKNFTQIGYYMYQLRCQTTTIGGYISGDLIVTGTGLDLTEGRSILYFAILIFLLFFFGLILICAFKIPGGNDKDEQGQIININNLKYFKGVLFFFAYLILISMFYFLVNICYGYLGENLSYKLLFVIFRVLYGLLLPIVIMWFIWIIVQIAQDKKLKGLISHGIYPTKL